MAVDGNLVFKTKIDLSGFSKDTKELLSSISSLKTKFEDVATAQNKTQKATDQSRNALSQMGSTLSGTETGLSRTESAVNDVGDALSKNEKLTKNTGSAYGSLSRELSEEEGELKSVRSEFSSLGSAEESNAKETQANAQAQDNLQSELRETQKGLGETRKGLNDVEGEFKKTGEAASESSGKLEKFSNVGQKIGAAFAKVGKAVVAGIGAASTAVGTLVAMSVKDYSDYEQLVGGVETLFKDSNRTVLDYANKAYKTAGMSANQYMETVTGFSASLIQSLGGDTKKAAEYANMAVTDMSDNANKMGTDIESIQNAYQGFAKQNYSMLDNLKLGYGGTQEEMYRLLQDAAKLDSKFAKTAKFSLDEKGHLSAGYADIVQAIHIVQTNLRISGITAEEAAEKVKKGEMTQEEAFEAMGTTAKEASTTIQGSIQSMQGAWTNLITGMADTDSDFDQLINNFISSVETVGKNIIPKIGVALNGVVNLVKQLAPKLIQALPGVLNQLLPVAIQAAKDLLIAVVGVLPQLGAMILKVLPQVISGIEQLFYGIVDALPSLVKIVAESLPTLIPQVISAVIDMVVYLMKHIGEILQPIIDNLPSILDSVVTSLMDNLPILIGGVISLVMGLVRATPQIIISLLQSLPTIIEKVVSGLLECLPQLIEGLIMLNIELVEHLPEIIVELIRATPRIIAAIGEAIVKAGPKLFESFGKVFGRCWEKLQEAFSGIGEFLGNLFSEIGEWFGNIGQKIGTFFSDVWQSITGVFSKVGEFFSNIFSKAVTGIKNAFSGIKQWFSNLWQGIWNVIKTPINWIIDGINALIGGLNNVKIDVPDWVPVIGGKRFGFDIPEIPRLATGTVVPANYGEFLAVLGDNKREPEIVSPISQMKQALLEALNERDGSGQTVINLNVDGDTWFSFLVKKNNQYKTMHGVGAF